MPSRWQSVRRRGHSCSATSSLAGATRHVSTACPAAAHTKGDSVLHGCPGFMWTSQRALSCMQDTSRQQPECLGACLPLAHLQCPEQRRRSAGRRSWHTTPSCSGAAGSGRRLSQTGCAMQQSPAERKLSRSVPAGIGHSHALVQRRRQHRLVRCHRDLQARQGRMRQQPARGAGAQHAGSHNAGSSGGLTARSAPLAVVMRTLRAAGATPAAA